MSVEALPEETILSPFLQKLSRSAPFLFMGVLIAFVLTMPYAMGWAGSAFAIDYGVIIGMLVPVASASWGKSCASSPAVGPSAARKRPRSAVASRSVTVRRQEPPPTSLAERASFRTRRSARSALARSGTCPDRRAQEPPSSAPSSLRALRASVSARSHSMHSQPRTGNGRVMKSTH